MEDEDSSIRINAAEAFGKIGSNVAYDALYGDSPVRISAAEALDAAIDVLSAALKHEDSVVRISAAEALGRIGSNAAVSSIFEQSDAARGVLVLYAAEVLDAVIDVLSAALKHEDSAVRISAAEALGRIGSNAYLGDLDVPTFRRRNHQAEVLEALRRIGNHPAIGALIMALEHEDSAVRISAAEPLGRISDRVNRRSRGFFRSTGDPLEIIGGDAAISALIIALKHKDSAVRRRAAGAFVRTGGDAAIGALIMALKHKDSVVRISAAEVLGRIGSDAAIKILTVGRGAFPFVVSLLHPRKLSKRHSSRFIILIYVPEKSEDAYKWIEAEERHWLRHGGRLEKYSYDVELPTDPDVVNIRLSSPAIDFSDEVTKVLSKYQVNSLSFHGQPKDTCEPGTHTALLAITDKDTGQEYKSIAFPVEVVDFAFDHVSTPSLSKLVTVILTMGSAATFVLTFLGQVDQTLGLASGGATGAIAAFIHMRFLSLFKLLRTSVVD